jgi:hypothetical protein
MIFHIQQEDEVTSSESVSVHLTVEYEPQSILGNLAIPILSADKAWPLRYCCRMPCVNYIKAWEKIPFDLVSIGGAFLASSNCCPPYPGARALSYSEGQRVE